MVEKLQKFNKFAGLVIIIFGLLILTNMIFFPQEPPEIIDSFAIAFNWVMVAISVWFVLIRVPVLVKQLRNYSRIDGNQFSRQMLDEAFPFLPASMQSWESEIYTLGFSYLGACKISNRDNEKELHEVWAYVDESKTICAELVNHYDGSQYVIFSSSYKDDFALETIFNLDLDVQANWVSMQNFKSIAAAYDYHSREQSRLGEKHGTLKIYNVLSDTIDSVNVKRKLERSISMFYIQKTVKFMIAWFVLACAIYIINNFLLATIGGYRLAVVQLFVIGAFLWFSDGKGVISKGLQDRRKPRKAAQ